MRRCNTKIRCFIHSLPADRCQLLSRSASITARCRPLANVETPSDVPSMHDRFRQTTPPDAGARPRSPTSAVGDPCSVIEVAIPRLPFPLAGGPVDYSTSFDGCWWRNHAQVRRYKSQLMMCINTIRIQEDDICTRPAARRCTRRLQRLNIRAWIVRYFFHMV